MHRSGLFKKILHSIEPQAARSADSTIGREAVTRTRRNVPKRFLCFGKRFLSLAIALIFVSGLVRAQLGSTTRGPSRPSKEKESAIASLLVTIVEDFIAASARDDIAACASYLAPKVYFYGHMRTRAQARQQMASLSKWWPQRRFAPPEDVSVFAIPNHPGFYKVTAVFEYERVSREGERITGKSKLSCVFEHHMDRTQITAVDERLLPETTMVYHNP